MPTFCFGQRTGLGKRLALASLMVSFGPWGFVRFSVETSILARTHPVSPPTVLISYGAWQKQFGGNPQVLGQTVTLADRLHTIIGVLPPEFHFAWLGPADFWVPLNEPNSCEQRRGCHSLFGVGRLKDGVTIETALAGMKLIAQRLEKRYPDSNRGFGADVLPFREVVSGRIRPILLTLLAGAGLLLLIACVNVSGLLVVRSEGRKREIALRSALGASRARIYRQFVTEGSVLVSSGSLLGLLLSHWAMRVLTSLIPADQMAGMPFLLDLHLNARVLGFSGVIALFAVVLFSLAPSLQFSSTRTPEGLAEGSRGSSGVVWRRVGPKLVVVELATAVVLLVAAGLLDKSFYKLLQVETGMNPEHLATLALQMPNANLPTERVRALERGILVAVESLPGVKSAGISTSGPITSWSMTTFLVVVGRPWNGEHNDVPARWVSAGYLKTLGARLVGGRYFTEAEDDESRPPVVLINQTLARKYFPGEDPLGKRLAYERSKDSMEIIGIVEDIKEGQLDSENRATLYAPFTQGWYSGFGLVVRASDSEQSLFASITAAIHQVDSGIVAAREMSMSEVINNSQSAYLHRTSAWLVSGFAAVALVLAIVGLYGTISYSVGQRRREIGIRIALGSDSPSVCRLILKEATWLTCGGIVLGLGFALAAGALVRGLLFGVQSWDIMTLVAVTGVLATVATLASYIPARRAASVNPADVLRTE
jgi:macrolide transport system ATP-binding/permease protein